MYFLYKKKKWGSKMRALFFLLISLIYVEKKIRLLRLTEIPWSFPGKLLWFQRNRGAPRGVTCVNFCWVCAAGLSEPLPHYSLFCGQLFVTFGQICNFWDPNLVTFYLRIYLINPLNRSSKNELPYWMKNTLLFTYCTNILVRLLTVNMNNSLNPKIRKCATPF